MPTFSEAQTSLGARYDPQQFTTPKAFKANPRLIWDWYEWRRAGVPIFYVQHADQKSLVKGSSGWQLHPYLQPNETDCVIEKQHGNAFEATNLDETLKARHVNTLMVTGLVTHGWVRATCLGAKELGYRVVLVRDARSNYHRQAAQLIETWHQKLGAEAIELEFTSFVEAGQLQTARSVSDRADGKVVDI